MYSLANRYTMSSPFKITISVSRSKCVYQLGRAKGIASYGESEMNHDFTVPYLSCELLGDENPSEPPSSNK